MASFEEAESSVKVGSEARRGPGQGYEITEDAFDLITEILNGSDKKGSLLHICAASVLFLED